MFFEQAAEIQWIMITNDFGDFRNIIGGGFKKALSIGDPKGKKVLCGGRASIIFKVPDEPADAHTATFGVFFDADRVVIMRVKMRNGQVHFINEKNRLIFGLFFLKSAD